MRQRLQSIEQDLLDLVEGRLPPERVESMRAALRADPALARKAQAMIADRARVQRMTIQDQQTAPAGLVDDAVTRAERDDLLHTVVRRRDDAAASSRRIAAMIALALLLGGVLTGSVVFLSSRGAPAGNHLARSDSTPRSQPPPGTFIVPEANQTARPIAPPLPDLLAAPSTPAVWRESELSPSGRRAEAQTPPIGTSGIPSAHDVVAQWNREVAEKIAGEGSASAGSRAFDAIVGGMRLSEAARLAMEGRLRITTSPRDPLTAARGLQAGVSLGGGTGQIVELASPDSFTIELTTRFDPELVALQDALAALADRLAGDGFGSRGRVRFSAAPEGDSEVAPAIASFRADDVLWWTRPASTWERAISVRAPVNVAAPAQ